MQSYTPSHTPSHKPSANIKMCESTSVSQMTAQSKYCNVCPNNKTVKHHTNVDKSKIYWCE